MGVRERYQKRKKKNQVGGSGGVRERYQARRRKQQTEERERKKPTAVQAAFHSGVKNYFGNKRAEETPAMDAGEGFAASVGRDYSTPGLRQQQVAAAHNKFTGGYTEAEIAEMKALAQAAEKAGEAQPWYKGFFQKSSGNVAAAILGTGLDAATAAAKGVLSLGEGLLDLGGYGLAGALDLFGADKTAEKIRKEAQKNVVEEGTKEATDFLDEYSVLGDTSKGVAQAAGQMLGIGAVGVGGELLGLGAKGVSALTTGTIGLSGAGSGMGEAYQGGATHGEALAYGLMSGSAEAVSELIFGGMGKGINALGFNKGLSSADDMLAKAVAKKFKSQFAKNLAEFGIKAGAEGAEEVIAGTAQALAKKLTYLSEEDLGKILADESLMEQFVIGSIVSGLAQTGGLVRSTAAGVDFISEDVQKAPIAPEAAPQGEGTRGVVGAAPYGAEGKTVPIAPPVTQNDEHGGSYEGKAGKDISDGNGRRDAGTGAGEQAGGLAAGTTERTNRTDRAREAAQIQTTAKDLRLESISSRELGIAAGTDARTVRVLPQGSWTEELKSLGKKVYDETGCQVTFTVGKMEIQGADGAMSAVRGVYEAGRIIVQADNLGVSPEQIADHEIYHAKRDFAGQILNEEIRVHILESYTREEYDAVLDRYIAGLRGVVDLDSAIDDAGFARLMQQVEEELFADAYAGINAFQGNAAKFTGAVRERMEQIGMPRTEVPIAPPVPEKARRPRDVPIAPPVPNSQASGNDSTGEKYSFAGHNAQNADSGSLAEAQQMRRDGIDKEVIRQKTGWFVGMDGKWRFELDDSKARIREEALRARYTTLGQLMEYRELYEAYPDMEEMAVTFQNTGEANGTYNRQFDDIDLSEDLRDAKKTDDLKAVLLHEVQHAIQNREGFTKGATVSYWQRRLAEGFDSRTADVRRKEAELTQQLERIREEVPQFAEQMDVLHESAPNVPRGKVDWDTLEQLEEDPVEWQQYDAMRERLEQEYGEVAVWDYLDLRYNLERATADAGRTAMDLYYDTAGEIEARNVAGRRNLTAMERMAKPPMSANDRTVFSDKGRDDVDRSIIQRQPLTEEEVERSIRQVAEMGSVYDVSGNEFAKGEKDLTTQVSEYFQTLGNLAYNRELGDVILDRKGVKDDIAHGIGRKKAAAFAAVPAVVEEGVLVDFQKNWKGRGYDTAVVAAPITIGGEDYFAAVVLTRNDTTNRFYVHEVMMQKNEALPFKTGTRKGNPGGDAPSVISILDRIRNVKQETDIIRYSLDEDKQNVPIAPPVEVTDEVESLEDRIAELEAEMAELNREEDYERYYRLSDERNALKTQLREARRKNPVKLTKRLATDMARSMRGSLGLFNREMATARGIIERYRTGQIADRAELREEISAKLGTFTEKNRDELVAEVKKTLRSSPITIAHILEFLKIETD